MTYLAIGSPVHADEDWQYKNPAKCFDLLEYANERYESISMDLMRKFKWSPQTIDDIYYSKIIKIHEKIVMEKPQEEDEDGI